MALAVAQHTCGQTELALRPLERALRMTPESATVRGLRALTDWSLGRQPEALRGMTLAIVAGWCSSGAGAGTAAIAHVPSHAPPRTTAARDHETATGPKAYPTQGLCDALIALGEALETAGRGEDAGSLYQEVLGLGGSEQTVAAASAALARVSRSRGVLPPAIRALADAADARPGDWGMAFTRADLLAESGDVGKAAKALRIALAARPECTHTLRRFALVAAGEEALCAWRRLNRLLPDDTDVCGRLLQALVAAGNRTEALPLARRWVVMNEGSDEARAMLDQVLAMPGEYTNELTV